MQQSNSFADPRMIHAIFFFAIIAVACLGHIHLRFMNTDMKLQHCELQKKLRVLLQEQDKLERQNEALCERGRLAELAQRERMQSTDVRHQVVAMIPQSLREKYSAPIKSSPVTRVETMVASASPSDLAERLLVLVDAAPAYAGNLPEKN